MSEAKGESRQGETQDRLVIYPRRGKLALLAIGALPFVVAGLVIGFAAGWRPTVATVVATYVGVPFFGFGFLYLIYRLAGRRPAVVVSEEGILDNATALIRHQVGANCVFARLAWSPANPPATRGVDTARRSARRSPADHDRRRRGGRGD